METKALNKEEESHIVEPDDSRQIDEKEQVPDDESKEYGEKPKEAEGFTRKNPAPFLYSAMFSHK